MYDVVLYEVFEEEEGLLKSLMPADLKVQYFSKTIQEEKRAKPGAPVISIRTQSRVPASWVSSVEGILTRSTGYDYLLEYQKLTASKTVCGYLPSYCSRAVAEQAILMMMAILRKLPLQTQKFNRFNRDGITGHECKGRNLLVVGVGRIGSETVDIARGLGMNVKGVDIAPKKQDVEYVSLEEGISWAQCVICAVPLTELTRGMLNYAAFKEASSKIVFVNIARGEISPLQDLKKLLDEGLVSGIALDVHEEEGRLAEYLQSQEKTADPKVALLKELQKKQDVLFTPHNAFNTYEALRRKAEQTVKAIVAFREEKTFPDLIPQE